MQFTRTLVFLVCVSYTLATTCAACAHELKTIPLASKCYQADAIGSSGKPETKCMYEEEDGIVMGTACTYDESGHIIQSSSTGACMESVPVNSETCPPCLV